MYSPILTRAKNLNYCLKYWKQPSTALNYILTFVLLTLEVYLTKRNGTWLVQHDIKPI